MTLRERLMEQADEFSRGLMLGNDGREAVRLAFGIIARLALEDATRECGLNGCASCAGVVRALRDGIA